ncbi:serine hydrolase domain-containing protein [Hymenobacter jeollabukensis]|uniref:Beta-lactamase family protein n=1 Tax=Hymenobacter jeollabukensis TaxID=2025313 RepID=A0A5R8WJF8_9BACT|nr:serine hydrolase domain-containing protein [Hymenobacter jeollabukensis]TLM88909.1 beta-lactamase family protein [Hymenobacter jeollabukensis]
MPRIITLLLLAGLALAATPTTAQKRAAPAVTAFLRQAMRENHIPGLAYAVVKDGKVIQQGYEGVANLAWNAPVDAETVFQTASCSKLFCSLLLGRLIDKGLLSPDETIGQLQDSIPYYWRDITIRQLASHQSGIWIAKFGPTKTSREAFNAAKEQRMEYEPGTRAGYVSSDYWILQYLLEQKLHQPYYTLLKQHVLDPLGMRHTFVNQNDDNGIRTHEVLPREAAVYSYFDNRYHVSDMQFGRTGYTAGGLYTSLTDFTRIAQVLDEGTFLKPATQAMLLTGSPMKTGGTGFAGLGFMVEQYQGHPVAGHSGGPALADFLRFTDQKLTLLVLTNQRGFYPYLAKGMATFYVPGLQMPEVPKTF